MGDVYDFSEGARLFVTSDPNVKPQGLKHPVLLDSSPEGRAAVEALRTLIARQVREHLAYLNGEWSKIDPQLLNLVEAEQARDMGEYAQAMRDALMFLREIAPIVDEDDDGDCDHEPAPDPAGSESA